ncbi:10357_t:CDS:2, partial [Paraglomus brasilianum]
KRKRSIALGTPAIFNALLLTQSATQYNRSNIDGLATSHMETDLPDEQYDNEQHVTKKICKKKSSSDPTTNKGIEASITFQTTSEKSGEINLPLQNAEMMLSINTTPKQTAFEQDPSDAPGTLPKVEENHVLNESVHHSVHQPEPGPDHMEWIEHVRIALANAKQIVFDKEIWNRDKILAAFLDPEKFKLLIQHKLRSKPTQIKIPQAIGLKFKYSDRAFFHTFTRRHDTWPQHQQEFMDLIEEATRKYKQMYDAHMINRENKDQITDLLKKKLAIDFWTNGEFTRLDATEIARHTMYLLGFARIETKMDFNTIKEIVEKAKVETLIALPDHPKKIEDQIKNSLPFMLPCQTADELPDTYFVADNRIPLSAHQGWLNETTQKMFPVTVRADLKKVWGYKEELRKFYIFRDLPETYFDLSSKKMPLPPTPQELTLRLREIFSFYLLDAKHFKEHIEKLRTVYAFKTLPNDYIISKKRLPKDPKDLHLAVTFSFPIDNKESLANFLHAVPRYYAIPNPLPKEYINFNYIDKPELPTDPSLVEKKVEETENKLPNTIKELKQLIEQKNLQTTLNFPISNQEKIPSAIEFLKQDLALDSIPDFAFKFTSFPSPGWELFEEAEIDDDIPMQENEPTQPTINTQGLESEEEPTNEC